MAKKASRRRYRSPERDSRWQQMAIKFRGNWELASLQLFGRVLTHQQLDVIREVEQKRCRVSVSSGHGTGKSDLLGQLAILYVILYPDSRVMVASNKLEQTLSGLLKYVKIHWAEVCKRHPWLKQYFEVTHKGFRAKCNPGVWCLQARSYRVGNEESLAGEHAQRLMWIVDEASGVSDKAFGIITGSLTELDNRLVMLSQPTRNAGFFYDSQHKNRKIEGNKGGIYTCLNLSSEESPLVTSEWIAEKIAQYGGRHAPDYIIKVLGRFADEAADGHLLSRAHCLAAQGRKIRVEKSWGWVGLVDVGDGGDKSVLLIGRVSGYGIHRRFSPYRLYVRKMRANRFARFVNAHAPEENFPGINLAVDAGGVGSPVADDLAELYGRRVQRINWGLPPFSEEERKRFVNNRAKANIWARDAVIDGRMSLPPGVDVIDQASRIPIEVDNQGRHAIMSKKTMRLQGLPSPDIWDCCCFVGLADYSPATRIMANDAAAQRAEALRLLHEGMEGE